MYSTFDELCSQCGVQKMETVGKTYMAAVGIRGTRKDHAVAAVELALEILELMRKCSRIAGDVINIRVGIHTGQVISGVVGHYRPQYSLFGDTVNTASRMQSTGVAQRVHISAQTYAKVCKDFKCESK